MDIADNKFTESAKDILHNLNVDRNDLEDYLCVLAYELTKYTRQLGEEQLEDNLA